MPGRRFVPRRGLVVAAVLTVVVAAVGLGVRDWLRTQPDVVAAAHSQAARAADRALTGRIDGQLNGLRAALPWADYLGTTTADVCSTQEVSEGFAIRLRDQWLQVTCNRTSTLYAAFTGDFRQRLEQLDTALAGAGWRSELPGQPRQPGERLGLVSRLTDIDRAIGGPDNGPAAQVPAVPQDVSLEYSVPITTSFVPPPGSREAARWGGTVEVAPAPRLPLLDDGTARHDTALAFPSVKTSYYVDWQACSRARLEAAYPAHSAVLAISVTEDYNTAAARSQR